MMIMNMLIVVIIMFILGNMIFVCKYKHLLIVLLSLEFMVLSIFFFFYCCLETLIMKYMY